MEYEELPREIISEYIANGFSTERLRIRNVNFDLERRLASASVDVETDFENSYEDGDDSWHWSAITAYRIVSQLAVGYICTELGKSKNEIGEIMQLSSRMNTTAPICQTEGVPVKVNFPKYIKRGGRIFGELEFDVADRTFHGGIRFAVDLRK